MKQNYHIIKWVFIIVAIAMQPAWADRIEVRGMGVAPYQDSLFSGDREFNAAKEAALADAQVNAWKNFVSTQNASLQQIIASHEAAFVQALPKFVVDVTVVDVSKDSVAKTLKLLARVTFNDVAIQQLVQSLNSATTATTGGGQSTFSFMFMARTQSQIKSFDARRTDVRTSTTAVTQGKDGAITSDAMTQSGGNTQIKSDEVTYVAVSNQDLNTAMGEVLSSSAGIEYVDYDDVVGNCHGLAQDSFKAEYATNDEMSAKTRSAIIQSLRACEVRYFATGTVDTLLPTKDPVSGGLRVEVTVRAQLWDISGRLPRRIASVGPKQFSAIGARAEIAGKNALVLAARDTAKTLVDQLNSKGIR